MDPRSALVLKRHLEDRLAAGRCGVLLATHSLTDVGGVLATPWLSPLNSVGAGILLSLLALRAAVKRLISRSGI